MNKQTISFPVYPVTADLQGDGTFKVTSPPPPEPKPAPSDTVRREIDRIARQLDGLTKSLKRVKDSL